MKINKFLTGTLFGLATGFAIANQLNKRRISPEKALHNVKNALDDQLVIEGSWIQMTPEKMSNGLLEHMVYRGGITSNEQNRINHYDFAVDAKTGTVLEVK